MDFTVIRDEKSFYFLREEWNNLLNYSEIKSVFLTWEWLYNWWKIYGEGRELFILCAYEGKDLVVILPLIRRKVKVFGLFEQVILEFLGTGEDEKDEVCSNHMEPIVYPGFENKAYMGLFSFLIGPLSREWDQLHLLFVRKDSPVTGLITSFFSSNGYLVSTSKCFNNGITCLNNGWEEYLKSLGKRTRKKIRQEKRLLESLEGFRYKFLKNESDFQWMFDAFVDLSLKRWNNGGAFSSQKFLEFQRRVCKEFLRKGLLKLSFVEVNGRVIAGNLDYSYKDTVYGYQTAFDPNFDPSIGVGIIGMLYCIEAAAREGFRRYDWYRTADGSYKSHFATALEEIISLKVAKKTIASSIEIFLEKIKESRRRFTGRKRDASIE